MKRSGVKKPTALFSGQEVARSLDVTQPRFARAVRNRKVLPDFVTNGPVDLFLPTTVRLLIAMKPQLFPS